MRAIAGTLFAGLAPAFARGPVAGADTGGLAQRGAGRAFADPAPSSARASSFRYTPRGRPRSGSEPERLQLTLLEDVHELSLIHISEPTRRTPISYAVFCL